MTRYQQLTDLMVSQAREALAAAGRGDSVAFRVHADAARETSAQIDALDEAECPACATHYFQPQECDWCPGQQAIHASNPATH